MSRDSSLYIKAAVASGPADDAAVTSAVMPTDVPSSPAAAPTGVVLQSEVVKMKEAITAPFMIYDAQTRRIVPNLVYNRGLLTEVRLLQSIALTKLRTPLQANLSYTPKELLYELEAALFFMCASAAVTSNEERLKYLMSDAEADVVMPLLESFLAHHNAPAKSTVTLAYCLTEGTSRDVLTSFVAMLQQRVEEELSPSIDRKRSDEERTALRSTKNNLNDIAQLLRDVATAYHCIDTPSQAQRRQPQSDPALVDVARSPSTNAVPAQMVDDAFYKVLRWVVAVDTDRRALKVAAAVAAGHGGTVGGAGSAKQLSSKEAAAVVAAVASVVSTNDTASSAPAAVAAATMKGFAKVVDYDPFTGQVTLERAGETQRWGLLLNTKGLLVGLENDLRNSSEAGERLYDAVQQQSGEAGGLAIYEVNRRRVRPVHLSEEALEASRADTLEKLRRGLTQPIKTLHLTIEKRKQADLTSPHEVLYEVSYQGGENGVGQRCLLMLQRASTSISWGLKLKYLKGAPAVLSDFAPSVRLSAAAKNFLFDARGRVRVLKINNQDLAKMSAAEMKELVSGALVITLNLQVTNENGDVLEGTPDVDEMGELPHIHAAQRGGIEEGMAKEPAAPEAVEAKDEEEPKADLEAAAAEEDDAERVELHEGEGEADTTATTLEKGSQEKSSAEQAELDDVAAAIADEFLLQEQGHDHLTNDTDDGATREVESMEKERGVEDVTAVEEDGHDGLGELDRARPTITDGAPGNTEGLNDDTADEHAAERALLREHHLLPDTGSGEEDKAEADEEAVEAPAENTATLPQGEGDLGDGVDAADAESKMVDEGGDALNEDGVAAIEAAEEGSAPAETTRKIRKGKEGKAAGNTKSKSKSKTSTKKKSRCADKEEAEVGGEGVEEDVDKEQAKDTAAVEDGAVDGKGVDAAADGAAEADLTDGAHQPVTDQAEEAPQKKTQHKKTVDEAQGGRSKQRGRAAAMETTATPAAVTAAEQEGEEGGKGGAEDDAAAASENAASGAIAKDAVEATSNALASAAAGDAPLVDLPSTAAELAIEKGKKTAANKKRGRAAKTQAAEEEDTESVRPRETMVDSEVDAPLKQRALAEDSASARVSLNELVSASPLTFENDVRLEKFDGSTLKLERSSVSSPWNIRVAFAGDDIIMTKLPPIPPSQLQHPFLRSLGAGRQGEVKWVVEGLNGQDLSLMNKTLKTKALDAIKGSTKLTFVLKALRK
jgi:hypothetical protein